MTDEEIIQLVENDAGSGSWWRSCRDDITEHGDGQGDGVFEAINQSAKGVEQ